MADIVRKGSFGDITFGMPHDIELLNKPWGFYELLGVPRDAPAEEIKRAYRALSLRLHPDRGGNEEDFKNLQKVAEILLDDGGGLGEEHSRKRQYDTVSSLDSFFDEYIQCGGARTRKLSEIMMIRMQAKRKEACIERDITQKNPRFAELKAEMEAEASPARKKQIKEQLEEIAAEAAGLTPQQMQEFAQGFEEAMQRHHDEERSFVRTFSQNPIRYFSRVLDIFHAEEGRVEFGQHMERAHIGFAGHDERGDVLEMRMFGDCYIAGFKKVHFKSPKADVKITDPNLEGIFHVMEGSIAVDFDRIPYGMMLRARAPSLVVAGGFARQGDLYVPERFAQSANWKQRPTLDIAVKEGSITLRARAQEFARVDSNSFYGNKLYDSLEDSICNKIYEIKKFK